MPKKKALTLKEESKPHYRYTVIYQQLSEGGYQVIVPALPGIITYGRTLSEARSMAEDAIICHIRGLLKDNEEVPEDPFMRKEPKTESLLVKV